MIFKIIIWFKFSGTIIEGLGRILGCEDNNPDPIISRGGLSDLDSL